MNGWGEAACAFLVGVVVVIAAWTRGHGSGWRERGAWMRCSKCMGTTYRWTDRDAALKRFVDTHYESATARSSEGYGPLTVIEQAQLAVSNRLELAHDHEPEGAA